jgi:hypothetical protein
LGATASDLHSQLHRAVRQHAAAHLVEDSSTTRSFVFDAPGRERSLAFLFLKLLDADTTRPVKDAVETLHQRLEGLSTSDFNLVGVMPHWHVRAHEEFSGGSPGSLPRPVYPDQVPQGWSARFYQPINPRLDLATASREYPQVPVAVLDTAADLVRARRRGVELDNPHLVETVDWLLQRQESYAPYEQELAQLAAYHAGSAGRNDGSEPPPHRMPDHGLFVAGLIHGTAPQAPLTLEPVLDGMGVGDLSMLLVGLKRVLARKEPRDPQIVNLSLGFVPHPARLPAAWYGLERPYDPAYLRGEELFDPRRDERWVAANRYEVDRTVDLLQAGLAELATYLSLNNCLVVAATGNDSLLSEESRHIRMEPRLPARFETVLGVAATTSNPRQPASYSNLGDERALGDHVATFGGNVTDGLQPEDGVMGIYAGEFPFQRPNETGWAWWSGTSFATAIVSGIAANLWTHRRQERPGITAAEVLAELHVEASAFGPYVPELRTPSIEVQGRWRR